jgi:ATP phosphoribosyltransferase
MSLSDNNRLRIAIQKSGRLSERSIALLEQCGLDLEPRKERLLITGRNFPIELMLVRDDDIPQYINDGVCDIGIAGRNVIEEQFPDNSLREIRQLGFGACRLSIAADPASAIDRVTDLSGKRIATSYPRTLSRFLKRYDIQAKIITIAGSVEITTALDIADAVCDLVSTGASLRANGLTEMFTILESEAVLMARPELGSSVKQGILTRLLQRMDGVMKAQRAKYIMMNAPASSIPEIKLIIPGMEEPTILPLANPGKVAIHAVAYENIFWETIERLKKAGASSILVAPIEKIID